MSTNPNTPETPARNLTNGEVELARRRAAAEEIAQRIAAFKRVASAPAEAPGSDGPSIPDGNPAPQDAPVPQELRGLHAHGLDHAPSRPRVAGGPGMMPS